MKNNISDNILRYDVQCSTADAQFVALKANYPEKDCVDVIEDIAELHKYNVQPSLL